MMYQSLKMLCLTLLLILSVSGQVPDSYDTLTTRGNKAILVPVYDTVKQLQEANKKADTILVDLMLIKQRLMVKNDTLKPKK
jgi:hypothetical protein